MRSLLSVVFILLVQLIVCSGHATELTSSKCSLALSAGVEIMESKASSSSARNVIVMRGNTQLNSGDEYVYGETLAVSISDESGEYVLQTSSASFQGGSCTGGTRVANGAGTLVIPSSGSSTVKVWGGFATSQAKVYIMSSVSLSPPTGGTPTTPSTASPTLAVTPSPTSNNDDDDDHNNDDDGPPPQTTDSPTQSPSLAPTIAQDDDVGNDDDDEAGGGGSDDDTNTDDTIGGGGDDDLAPVNSNSNQQIINNNTTTAGVVAGLFGVLIFCGACFAYAIYVESGKIDREAVNTYVVKLGAIGSVISAIVGTGLVGAWARNATPLDTGYLGKPDWSSNVFAYHPTLMVGGFVMCQIFAICAWSLMSVHYNAKLTHVMFQVAALSCMIAGFAAIAQNMEDNNSPTFTTMHSWVGVAAVCAYSVNFLWGSCMALLTACLPESVLRKSIDLRFHHRFVGQLALFLSLLAVLTGIMDQLPQGTCRPILNDGTSPGFQANSGRYYEDVPISCRIGMGVGIATAVSCSLAALIILQRGDSFHLTKK